jgi:hypothetical protein
MPDPLPPALFDIDVEQSEAPAKLTPAQAMRARQAARIAAGVHPLALDGASLRLHPDAATDDGPTCGTCVHRQQMGGHAKNYPKCLYGYTKTPIPAEQQRPGGPRFRITMPRVTRGAATDVRAGWPACTDWAPTDPTA